MATAITAEEISRLVKKVTSYSEEMASDPEKAKRVLHKAGIHTKTGKLTKPYSK